MAHIFVLGNLPEALVGLRGELMLEMIGNGHQVTASVPAASEEIRRKLRALGAGYLDIPLERAGMNPWHDARYFYRLVRAFRRVRPDVLFTYTIKPSIFGSLAARIAGVPLRSSMINGLGYSFSAGTGPARLLLPLVRSLYRLGLRKNRVVFFQNPDDMNLFRIMRLVRDGNRPTLLNGSGINLTEFPPAPLPPPVSFLLIARMIRDKGIREYVAAARAVRARHPSVRFRVVGWMDESRNAIGRDEIDGWIREGVIDYLGKLDDVRPAIADASVFVLPSFYREGTPRTILEALAMGRPVITTDAPGCRETVISGRNGFLVPVMNVPALVRAMEKFVEEPGLVRRMGAESRLLAEEKYDVKKVNRTILENLGLLAESGPRPVQNLSGKEKWNPAQIV